MNMIKLVSYIIERDGPFSEFKQDASIVSVKLKSGKIYHQILLLYPDCVIGMNGYEQLPFRIEDISEVFQDEVDLSSRSEISWLFKG